MASFFMGYTKDISDYTVFKVSPWSRPCRGYTV
jgi:hypothetical protein